jgi:hypothetical protein
MNRTLILAPLALAVSIISSAFAQQGPAYPAPVAVPSAGRSAAASPAPAPATGAAGATPVTATWSAAPPMPTEVVSNPKLRDELLAMRDEDQRVRRAWIADPKNEKVKTESKVVDERNVARVAAIIDQSGWPTVAAVGEKGSAAAWIILQHAPLAVQEKYLEIMKAAASRKDLSWALLATTIDRVRIGEGKLQLYGTQYDTASGHFGPLPVEDPAGLDSRRREAGLTTMADYDDAMRRTYNQPPRAGRRPIGPAPNVNP